MAAVKAWLSRQPIRPAALAAAHAAATYRPTGNNRTRSALATGYRVPSTDQTYYRLRLHDASLLRRLTTGRYVLGVSLGRSRTDLGAGRQVVFNVTPR